MVSTTDFGSPPVSPGTAFGAANRSSQSRGPAPAYVSEPTPSRDTVLAHLKALLQPVYNRGGISRAVFVSAVKNALAEVLSGGSSACAERGWQQRCSQALARQLARVRPEQADKVVDSVPIPPDGDPRDDVGASSPSRSRSGSGNGCVLTFDERRQQRQRQLRDWRKAQLERQTVPAGRLTATPERRRPAAVSSTPRRSPLGYSRRAAAAAARGSPQQQGRRGGGGMTPATWRSPALASPDARSGDAELSYDARGMMQSGVQRIETLVRKLADASGKPQLCDVVLHEIRNYHFYASVAASASPAPSAPRSRARTAPEQPHPAAPSAPASPIRIDLSGEEGRRRAEIEQDCHQQLAITAAARDAALSVLRLVAGSSAEQSDRRATADAAAKALSAQSDKIDQLFASLEEKERKLEARRVSRPRRAAAPPRSPPRSPPTRQDSPRGSNVSAARSGYSRTADELSPHRGSRAAGSQLTRSPPLSVADREGGGTHPNRSAVVEYIRSLLQPIYNSGAMDHSLFSDVVRGVSRALFQRRWPAGDAAWQTFVRHRIAQLIDLHEAS